MNPESSPPVLRDALAISEAMVSVLRAHTHLKVRLASATEGDVSGTMVLVRLAKEGPRRASELASAFFADPSTVSRQVAALVKAGLIERRADPDDGRASILWATPAGQTRAREFTLQRGRAMSPIVAEWTPEERITFVRLLTSYASGLEQHREQILGALTCAPGQVESPITRSAPTAIFPPAQHSQHVDDDVPTDHRAVQGQPQPMTHATPAERFN